MHGLQEVWDMILMYIAIIMTMKGMTVENITGKNISVEADAAETAVDVIEQKIENENKKESVAYAASDSFLFSETAEDNPVMAAILSFNSRLNPAMTRPTIIMETSVPGPTPETLPEKTRPVQQEIQTQIISTIFLVSPIDL